MSKILNFDRWPLVTHIRLLPRKQEPAAVPAVVREALNLAEGLCTWLLHRYGNKSVEGTEGAMRQPTIRAALAALDNAPAEDAPEKKPARPELPDMWSTLNGRLRTPAGETTFDRVDWQECGSATIRQAVEAWLAEMEAVPK